MTLDHRVRERLLAIEALLRETEHWQDSAPDSRAFASEQPFCLDTMEPIEWLQWVLIPRMRQLLEAPGDAPAIQVVELARVEKEGAPISASRVRRLYQQRQWSSIAPLVPPGTLSFLMHLAESEHQTA